MVEEKVGEVVRVMVILVDVVRTIWVVEDKETVVVLVEGVMVVLVVVVMGCW